MTFDNNQSMENNFQLFKKKNHADIMTNPKENKEPKNQIINPQNLFIDIIKRIILVIIIQIP